MNCSQGIYVLFQLRTNHCTVAEVFTYKSIQNITGIVMGGWRTLVIHFTLNQIISLWCQLKSSWGSCSQCNKRITMNFFLCFFSFFFSLPPTFPPSLSSFFLFSPVHSFVHAFVHLFLHSFPPFLPPSPQAHVKNIIFYFQSSKKKN